MSIRFKLLLPLTIGLMAFILFVHFYWVNSYLNSEYRHYKKTHALLIKTLEPEITRAQTSGDFLYLRSFLDWQMNIHKEHWLKLVLYDKKGQQLYPLTESSLKSGKYTFKLQRKLHFNGNIYSHLVLTVDWKNERQEELQRVHQLEKLLIAVFLIITIASAFWQNRLVCYPLSRLKKAVVKLSEGDYQEPLATSGNDEIGKLTQIFEQMRVKLKQYHVDLQKALMEARYNEAQQRAVINSMDDALIIIDENGTIESCNPATEHIFGYATDEILDKNIKFLIPYTCNNAENNKSPDFLKPLLSGKVYETGGRHKDGSSMTVELRTGKIDIGEKRRYSSLIRNISQRKHIETELRIAAIAFNSQEGIIITDSQANILRVNQASSRITGYTEDELIGRNPRILQSERHSPKFFAEMWDSLKHTGQWSSEIWDRRKNGEIFPQWISITAVKDDDGAVTHYVGSFLDISELREKQLQLEKQTQELSAARDAAEAAARAKSEFLSIMSHEIRTPLNGILGMTQLLGNTQLDKKQKEYLKIVTHSGNSLLRIIDDILDFSKMSAENMKIERLAFDLEQTAFHVIRLLKIKAEKKGLKLKFIYAPECPRHLLGDAGRIRQILINLVNNAIKFTKHGHVSLAIACLPDCYEYAQFIFKISDTGIGITPENQLQLFKSFSQADASTTRKFGGTGLGLAICKKLVSLMQGEISIESKFGKGATFIVRLRLPIYRQPESGC